MDPNETLRLAREADSPEDAAYYYTELDQWISRGGFLPSAWQKGEGQHGH